jgi:hypothetical protein
MPTVLRVGPYRFYFFVGDQNEPPHIHVRRDKAEAKFWLMPIQPARQVGFAEHELRDIERIIQNNHPQLIQAWNDAFNP